MTSRTWAPIRPPASRPASDAARSTSEHLGVSFFRYPADFRVPFGHKHREQEEAYVIVEGSGRMRAGDEVVDLKQWDIVRVAPQVVRGFEAGPDGLAMIAVGNDRPEGGDGEMIQDFWTD
jgi:mannose-6-phosphate isomerase-like protein (cupin superfamily)